MPDTATLSESRWALVWVRVGLVLGGCAALAWVALALPAFWNERAIAAAGQSIAAGEAYRPHVLASLVERLEGGGTEQPRAAMLGRAVLVRLRRAEAALRGSDTAQTDRALSALASTMDRAFERAPLDSFLWLGKFWLESTRSGFGPDLLPYLRRSYALGPNEGWVSVRRNTYVMPTFTVLPVGMADLLVGEYASLVRWGLIPEAADIAVGPGRPVRARLFEALREVREDQRRALARELFRREFDDVPIPGVEFSKLPWGARTTTPLIK